MKLRKIVRYVVKTVCYTALALVLLLVGTVMVLYSPWMQRQVTWAINEHFRSDDLTIELQGFRLRPPLRLEVTGLTMITQGDTIAKVASLDANVSLLGLTSGSLRLEPATVTGAHITLDGADTAITMRMHADTLCLDRITVGLGTPMDINLERGRIAHARVGIAIQPTESSDTTSAPTMMRIRVGHLDMADFGLTMAMPPIIDTISATIPQGLISDADIDLSKQAISVASFTGSGLDARYITPASDTLIPAEEAEIAAEEDDSTAQPWTVTVAKIHFTNSHALYALAGYTPTPGLDFSYIEVSKLDLQVDSLYNRASDVRLPLHISGRERCGVVLDAQGTVAVTAEALRLDDFVLRMPDADSRLRFDAMLGMGNMMSDASLPVALHASGNVGTHDIGLMFPAAMPMLAGLPADDVIDLGIDLDGTMGHLTLNDLNLLINGCAELHGHGTINSVIKPDELSGHIALNGRIINSAPLRRALFSPDMADLRIPPMTLQGKVDMAHGTIVGDLTARTGAGRLALDGRWNSRRSTWDAGLKVDSFPVQTFMPRLGIGAVTARFDAGGNGFDPFDASTEATANLVVTRAAIDSLIYRNITLEVSLAQGIAQVKAESDNRWADFTLTAEGNLTGDAYDWTARLDGRNVDLHAFNLTPEETWLSANLDAHCNYAPPARDIDALIAIHSFEYITEASDISVSDINAHLQASDSTTMASITNRDLRADFHAAAALDSLLARVSAASDLMATQFAERRLRIDTLQRVLPTMRLDMSCGSNNMINQVLEPNDMGIGSMWFTAANDSTLTMAGQILAFQTGETAIDTINISAHQLRSNLGLSASIGNRPGTLDDWAHVGVKAYVDTNRMGVHLTQRNIQGDEGFNIGLGAMLADSTLRVHLKPYTPIIGYKQWTVNDDNFLSYCLADKHFDANLHMASTRSAINIYTVHDDGDNHHHDSDAHREQEDLIVQITDIQLQDWIAINPFAPPVKGSLGADLRINYNAPDLNGSGRVSLDDLVYGRERVGSFMADVDLTTGLDGRMRAQADLYVDSVKTITVAGAIGDVVQAATATAGGDVSPDSIAASAMRLDFSMIHFPLATVNPFLPAGTARLSGTLNGSLDITGDPDSPHFDGWFNFDSTAMRLALTGTDYGFSDERIPVTDGIVHFDKFAVRGVNANPLTIDGTVDISSLSSPSFDLALNADNMQLVGTSRASKGADVYGKAFISLDATASGDLDMMSVDAKLTLLPGTNVTYVMPDAVNAITSQSSDEMVKFVNFADTAAVTEADSLTRSSMILLVDALLTIDNGAIISVDLSANGKDKVQIQPTGTLNYTLSPVSADGRLSGRININKGFVRYTPPILSEKLFNFNPDSYIAFNGDILNPTINILATDVVKANVTQSGQNSRLVDFDVKLAVTGTLNTMKVDFDLSTENDITVANELSSMSPDQRANQAMALLLYNTYTGPGTTGNASLGGNALYTFLESQLNSWAANTIKGVDISFGIDQYERTLDGQTSQTTNYSYQVSKSLFNDRFKIVVGGSYSTDADADENFSQNLINDISFEYFLNNARTMYVRLFRHTGYESILEGEVTQTGVGFVYKRRLRRVSDMFRFLTRWRQSYLDRHAQSTEAAPTDSLQPNDTPAQ